MPLKDSIFEKVVKLAKEGVKQADISRQLNVNRSTVSRHVASAKVKGRL